MPLTRVTSQLISIPSNYPLTGSLNGTASYAITSSFAMNGGTGGGGTTLVTGSTYPITSSWSNNSVNSNYSNISISSSFATSATSATSASYSLTSSYSTNAANATSATNATNSTSASYSLTSSYSVNSNTAISSSFASTASYNLNSISSSYALTSSFALNGGGGTTLTTGSTYPITSSWAINAITASYALNSAGGGGGSGGNTQTGSIANQTILYNVTTSQDNVISGLNLSSNKWGVTVVEEWNSGSVPGDDYYNSCSLLMHFSGSNGSTTTFIDNSPNNLTATSNNGASISTVQSKFGGSSLLLDGTNDYLSVANSTVFDLTGDYTIEFWAYSSNFGAGGYLHRAFYSTGGLGWTGGMSFSIRGIGGIRFYFYATTNANEQYIDVAAPSSNTWHHFAMVKSGTTGRVFIDGTLAGTINSLNTPATNTQTLRIGVWDYSAGAEYFNGYIDEIRITKGYARYTGSFVTQSIEFPNNLNVTQYATKYIGLVGGLNDSTVDYGVEKLSDSSLKIRKMTASGQPLSGSGTLSASVDRVYVNVLDYTNVMVTSSYALTASYVLGGIQTGSISNQTILYNVTTSQDNTITGLDLSGNKWDVSVIEEWNSASVPGDLYYNSNSLLMHFSGSDGSTTFTDNSPTPKSFTRSGNAQVSTVQSKFGGSSLYCDGSGDYITTTYNTTAFDWWTTDYTIECFIYPNNSSSLSQGVNNTPALIGNMDPGSGGSNYWSFGPNNNKQLSFYYWNGSAGNFIASTETTVVVGQWNHIAMTKNSTGIRLFINGVASVTSASVSGTPQSSVSSPLTIGQYFNVSINAYIDEVRITKGVARYTASFTVPDSAFPDTQGTTPQYATKYIGLVGGINDSTVDYGVEKLSDTSLKIRKMAASGQPLSGSGALSASVDRVYVNVLNYKNVQTTTQSASYALSASYASGGGGTTLVTGSTYPITSSWSTYVVNASSGESFHPFLLG